jgi:predicted Zn finger-like uncharacterized protein
MQVACEHCGTEYSLDEENITGRGVRITCPSCSHVFTVYKPQEEIDIDLEIDDDLFEENKDVEIDIEIDLEPDPDEVEVVESLLEETFNIEDESDDDNSVEEDISPELEDLPAVTEEALAAMDVNTLDFQKVGLQAWKVKSSIGLVYEFSDYKTLKNWMKTGRVKESDPLSHDGEEWIQINNIDNIERHFCEVYLNFLKLQENADEDSIPFQRKTIKQKTLQPGGISELDAAIADLSAEVDGANPYAHKIKTSSHTKRPNRRGRSNSKQKEKKKSSSLPLVLIVIIVGIGVWLFSKPGSESVANETPSPSKQPTTQQVDEGKDGDNLRAEIQEKIKRSAEQRLQENQDEPKVEEEEQQLIPVIPAHLRKQVNSPSEKEDTPKEQKPKNNLSFVEKGEKAISSKNWNDAASAYQKAYQNKRKAVYKERWGYSLYRAGKTSEAKKILKQSVKEGNVLANKWLGEIYKNLGDDANANTYFTAYLKSNPSDADAIRKKMLK